MKQRLQNIWSKSFSRLANSKKSARQFVRASPLKPEELKRQRAHLTAELQTIKTTIDRTFKIQVQMDADSEGIKLVAQELETLGRKKKVIADQHEQLRASESHSDDAAEAQEHQMSYGKFSRMLTAPSELSRYAK